ncbi:MAG: multidrug efflux SMR transporter [Solirubrobacterales bacterium]
MLGAWLLVTLAIVLEVAATTFLKVSEGFTRRGPAIVATALYVAAFACLGVAVATLEVGTVYAVWAGAGTALVAMVGSRCFGERMRWPAWAGIGLIVVGVLFVELFSPA